MHIGELALKADVNIQTIRFYERERLLPAPVRNQSGYRCYGPGDIERVTFIRRNQELGFTLEEIKQLLDLHRVVAGMTFPMRQKPAELRGIIDLGRERLASIDAKLSTLRKMRRRLDLLLHQLEAVTLAACPAAQPAAKRKNPRNSLKQI